MEPLLCPNGHPNRPGTRICAVCLALIPSPAGPTSSNPAADKPPAAPRRPPATSPSAAPRPDHRPPPANPPPPPPDPGSPAAGPDPAPQSPAEPPARRKSGRGCWLLALLLLLLLVLAIAAVVALFYPIRQRAEYLATAVVVSLATETAAIPTPVAATEPVAPGATAAVAAEASSRPPTATPVPTVDPRGSPTPVATITPLGTVLGIVLSPTAAPVTPGATLDPGMNLIQNGEFRDDWVNGWERESDGLNGAQVVEVRQLAGDPPLPAIYVGKSGAGVLRIHQHVTLTGAAADLVFRARVRLAGVTQGAAEGRAALVLVYEDAAGEPLGASVWLDNSAETSALWGSWLPAFGPTTAPRSLANGWQTIDLPLRREFVDRLPDLDAAAVRRLTVQLVVVGAAACAPEACPSELDAAELSLSAAMSE